MSVTDQDVRLIADGIEVTFDPTLGMVLEVVVESEGRRISPFAKAPWRELPAVDPRFPDDMAPHLARLSGDFFCAPFSVDDIDGAPVHGKTANGPWQLVDLSRRPPFTRALYRLADDLSGATVTKALLLVDEHPFLYQQHVIEGADLSIPVGHHAMIDASGGLDLALSRKAFAETPAISLESDPERGRSILAYPARSPDLAAFPMADDALVSLLEFPMGQRHEDFVMLVDEDRGTDTLGWAIARRRSHRDSVILAKPTGRLPQTMLWYSNGGRDYAPWLGQHVDVLGIEEACSYSLNGWAASIAANPLNTMGIPTAVTVGATQPAIISFAMGATAGEVEFVDGGFIRCSPSRQTLPFERDYVTGVRRFEELF